MSDEELSAEDKKIIRIMQSLEEEGFEILGYFTLDPNDLLPTIEEEFASLYVQAKSFLSSKDNERFMNLFNQYLDYATHARQS